MVPGASVEAPASIYPMDLSPQRALNAAMAHEVAESPPAQASAGEQHSILLILWYLHL